MAVRLPADGDRPPREGDRPPVVAIIGAGAAGTALARGLHSAGYPIAAVISRHRESAERLGGVVASPIVSDRLEDVPTPVTFVFICVPDAAIGETAAQLASLSNWRGAVVAHLSGALPASSLAPVAEAGARVLSFHPAQTLPPGSGGEALRGAFIALEGDAEAVIAGERIAEDLGAHPFRIASEKKALYHLAAVMASNYLVTLNAAVRETLSVAGLDQSAQRALFDSLGTATLRNLRDGDPAEVLTGPIVRADAGTIERHLAALRHDLPHLETVYKAMGRETVRLALNGNRIASSDASMLLNLLKEGDSGLE